jgi:molybdopterin-guanine dinucleotide biosynthesis protein A
VSQDPIAVSGIVLAGGRSSRFGSDKLEARIDGRRIIDRAVGALAPLVSEIVIVSEPGVTRAPPEATGRPIRIVEDPAPFGGPLVALLAGLEAASEPLVVVVGGDMPSLVPEVLSLLIARLVHEPGRDAVVLASRGRPAPLPAALRTGAATDLARRLIADGEQRLRTVTQRLATVELDEAEWRALDPSGETLRDVDRPEDLPSA